MARGNMKLLQEHWRALRWAIDNGACRACALHTAAMLMAKAHGDEKPERALTCSKGPRWLGSACEERLRDAYKKSGGPWTKTKDLS